MKEKCSIFAVCNKISMRETRRNIAVLGSTGSIGRQTLDIIAEYPDMFNAWLLVARSSADLLIQQARQFRPHMVIIADEQYYEYVRDALEDTDIEVATGSSTIAQAVTAPEVDTVVTAMVGYSGLESTIAAIGAGKRIALANKETLVVAGELIDRLLKDSKSVLYPVDSEHGAFYQCLVGERMQDVEKLWLTASGGPFRTFPKEKLTTVTAADALKHPNWSMGAKRGSLAVWHLAARHRDCGASPKYHPLYGGFQGRLGEGPVGVARHAPAHPLRLGTA